LLYGSIYCGKYGGKISDKTAARFNQWVPLLFAQPVFMRVAHGRSPLVAQVKFVVNRAPPLFRALALSIKTLILISLVEISEC
jgi:hypothetical protein